MGIYYRHKPGGAYGCKNKSVPREIYEADFLRLIELLQINAEAIDEMIDRTAQTNPNTAAGKDLEAKKAEEIALCRRRIQAAIDLYGDGRIERNEREIASWQARTNESEKLAIELAMCMYAIETITRLWEVNSNEDKQGMSRHVFEYLVYDLDRQEIVDFRLKGWADQFLVLRAALYAEELHNAKDYNDNRIAPSGLMIFKKIIVQPTSRTHLTPQPPLHCDGEGESNAVRRG